jgi:AhpD family alkylhydroperoxidase
MQPKDFHAIEPLSKTQQTDALTEREKHLIGLVVSQTRGCEDCTGTRIRKAIDAGLDRETIRAALDLSAAVNAGVTVRTALSGAEQHAAEVTGGG